MPRAAVYVHMGNAISSRKPTEPVVSCTSGTADSDQNDAQRTAATAMDELTRDVQRLKAAMDEKDRTVCLLGQAVDDIRVSRPVSSYAIISRTRASPTLRVRGNGGGEYNDIG